MTRYFVEVHWRILMLMRRDNKREYSRVLYRVDMSSGDFININSDWRLL